MNIEIQCCGLIILFVITYFYYNAKRIGVKTQITFTGMLISVMVCLVMDVVSILAIINRDAIPLLLCELICKGYLLSLLFVIAWGLLYLCADIYPSTATFRRIVKMLISALAVAFTIILILPIRYYYNPVTGDLYSKGPSVIAAYVTAFLLLLTIFSQLKAGAHKIGRRRRMAILIWVVIWLCAALIQLFNSRLLIVSFSGVVSIMIIYLMLENPDANLDRRTGFFNQNALFHYLGDLYADHVEFSMLALIMKNEISVAEMEKLETKGIAFRDSADEIVLVFRNKNALDELKNMQHEMEGAKRDVVSMWICVPKASVAGSVEELLYLLGTGRHRQRDRKAGNLVLIDRDFVDEIAKIKETETLIQEAIEQDRVEVFYQPIYSAKEEYFASAEALVRIRAEDGNPVPPGVFIPIAEENKMIIDLGKIVFEKVCAFLSQHTPEELGIDYIEVNLSVVQCTEEKLAEDLLAIMQKHGVPAKWINLEITESASIEIKQQILKFMHVLSEAGIHFSLDDFGTGQSNLNYIVDMPVDIVKFDRSMTQSYFQSGRAKYVLDASVQMIHGMGLDIVSEGIETEEQYEIIKNMGIHYIQGYYFSKPLPEKVFLHFLQTHNKHAESENE